MNNLKFVNVSFQKNEAEAAVQTQIIQFDDENYNLSIAEKISELYPKIHGNLIEWNNFCHEIIKELNEQCQLNEIFEEIKFKKRKIDEKFLNLNYITESRLNNFGHSMVYHENVMLWNRIETLISIVNIWRSDEDNLIYHKLKSYYHFIISNLRIKISSSSVKVVNDKKFLLDKLSIHEINVKIECLLVKVRAELHRLTFKIFETVGRFEEISRMIIDDLKKHFSLLEEIDHPYNYVLRYLENHFRSNKVRKNFISADDKKYNNCLYCAEQMKFGQVTCQNCTYHHNLYDKFMKESLIYKDNDLILNFQEQNYVDRCKNDARRFFETKFISPRNYKSSREVFIFIQILHDIVYGKFMNQEIINTKYFDKDKEIVSHFISDEQYNEIFRKIFSMRKDSSSEVILEKCKSMIKNFREENKNKLKSFYRLYRFVLDSILNIYLEYKHLMLKFDKLSENIAPIIEKFETILEEKYSSEMKLFGDDLKLILQEKKRKSPSS